MSPSIWIVGMKESLEYFITHGVKFVQLVNKVIKDTCQAQVKCIVRQFSEIQKFKFQKRPARCTHEIGKN